MRARARGLTVAEVLVYSVLALALLAGIHLYVQSGMRLYRGGENHKELQKEALITMRRLTGELSNSTAGVEAGGGRIVLPTTGEDKVIYPSADDLATAPNHTVWLYQDPTGDVLWRKWVLLSFDSDERALRKREIEISPDVVESSLGTPPETQDFPTAGELIGKQLEDVRLTWLHLEEVLELVVVAKADTVTGAAGGTRIEMKTSVHIQN